MEFVGFAQWLLHIILHIAVTGDAAESFAGSDPYAVWLNGKLVDCEG